MPFSSPIQSMKICFRHSLSISLERLPRYTSHLMYDVNDPFMKKNYSHVFLVLLTFFVISFLSNIIGPLVPEIIEDFRLSLTMVSLLPFAFFIAYGLMSIPSGIMVEQYGEKVVMIAAFGLSFI